MGNQSVPPLVSGRHITREIEVHLLRRQVPLPKSISNLGQGSVALLIAAFEQKKKTGQKCVS